MNPNSDTQTVVTPTTTAPAPAAPMTNAPVTTPAPAEPVIETPAPAPAEPVIETPAPAPAEPVSSVADLAGAWGAQVTSAARGKPAEKPKLRGTKPQTTASAAPAAPKQTPQAAPAVDAAALQAAMAAPVEVKVTPPKRVIATARDAYAAMCVAPLTRSHRLVALALSANKAGQCTFSPRNPVFGTVYIGPVFNENREMDMATMTALVAAESMGSQRMTVDVDGRITRPWELFPAPRRVSACADCGKTTEEGLEDAVVKHRISCPPHVREATVRKHFDVPYIRVKEFCFSCEDYRMRGVRAYALPGDGDVAVIARMVDVYNRRENVPEYAVLPRLMAKVPWDGQTDIPGWEPSPLDVALERLQRRADEGAVAAYGMGWEKRRSRFVPAELALATGQVIEDYALTRNLDLDLTTIKDGVTTPVYGLAIGWLKDDQVRGTRHIPGLGFKFRLMGGRPEARVEQRA